MELAMPLLLSHPDTEAINKIREEIDVNRLLNDSDLPNLHYLHNVIKECTRQAHYWSHTSHLMITQSEDLRFHVAVLFVNVYAIQRPKSMGRANKVQAGKVSRN